MGKKIKETVKSSGAAAAVSNATSMSDGKTYVRNPANPNQILQVQEKQGNQFMCYVVTKKEGTVITVDSTKAIYVHEDTELMTERI